MSILTRIREAIEAPYRVEVPKPRRFLSGTCAWCHRPWTEGDPDVRVMADPNTGKDVAIHGCGWFLTSDDDPRGLDRWH